MKKTLLTLVAGLGVCSMSYAQMPTITNGTMETWVSVPSTQMMERPTAWYGSDQVLNQTVGPLLMLSGANFVSNKQLYKDTDKFEGTYAARLVTKDFGDTLHVLPVLMTNAKQTLNVAGLLGGGTGGMDLLSLFKFTQMSAGLGKRIDSVTAYVKVLSTNGDASAALVTAYKKVTTDSMTIIGQGAINIPKDLGAGAYTKVSIPVDYMAGQATDSFVVGFTSSGVASDTGFTVNNTLFVDKVEVFASEPSGISTIRKADLGFSVYPNPAVSNINFENRNSINGAKILIQNSLGQVMHCAELTAGENAVDLTKYATGTYFYEIYNNKGTERQMGKFVK